MLSHQQYSQITTGAVNKKEKDKSQNVFKKEFLENSKISEEKREKEYKDTTEKFSL